MTFKEFRSAVHEKWIMLKIFLQLKLDALRLDFACYMADALQRAKNKRFYVLDNGNGRLIWLCNDDIKIMKKPRYARKLVYDPRTGTHKLKVFKVRLIQKDTSHLDVMRDCYYYTPESRNNSIGITVEERNRRRMAWVHYMEQVRMDRMFGKRKVVTKK